MKSEIKALLFVALAFIFVCMVNAAFAYDTYIYRVQVDQIITTSSVKSSFTGKGQTGTYQPFYNTYVLAQADTNYVLVKITPSSDVEDAQAKINFGYVNADLWAQIHNDYGQLPVFVVDNRQKYSIEMDWSVKKSS